MKHSNELITLAENRRPYAGRTEYRIVLRPGIGMFIQKAPSAAEQFVDFLKITQAGIDVLAEKHFMFAPGRDQSAAIHDFVQSSSVKAQLKQAA